MLVLEDDACARDALVSWLAACGCQIVACASATAVRAALVPQLFADAQVEQASDAAMALEQLLQDDTFDLVLLDLKMHGLDGSTALTVLRRRHPPVLVVAVSAHEGAATIRACIDAGASGYIPRSARREIISAALAIVADGEPNKTIARRLAISEATVRAHLGGVFRALGVTNRTQAALSARRLGLCDATSGSSHSDA